jgi:hypothetical protein
MYIAIWASLISGIIIINSMLRIYYTTKCISNKMELYRHPARLLSDCQLSKLAMKIHAMKRLMWSPADLTPVPEVQQTAWFERDTIVVLNTSYIHASSLLEVEA